MKITAWKSLFAIVIFTSLFTSIQASPSVSTECQQLPTYFQYNSNEIKELSEKRTSARMSKEELIKWDEITAALIKKFPSTENYRMYAYLYTAQKDAAYLSYHAHGQYLGSLGPISAKVLKLFFPSTPSVESDEYSEYLANIIFANIKERFDEETHQMENFPINENDQRLQDLPKPYAGLKVASCKPWLLKDPMQFKAPKPPAQNDPYWVEQAEIVKKISENCTQKQIQAAKFWAGEAGPKSGDWMYIVNQYMYCQKVPFSKILCVRSILAEAGVDIDMALFYTKYTYVIKRPSTINSTIHQHIPFPKHPSYPSGHSTWSSACATILTYYFPEKKDYWFQLAEEAGFSRIWGGIHYPIDHEGGWTLGIQLGNAILQSPKLCP